MNSPSSHPGFTPISVAALFTPQFETAEEITAHVRSLLPTDPKKAAVALTELMGRFVSEARALPDAPSAERISLMATILTDILASLAKETDTTSAALTTLAARDRTRVLFQQTRPGGPQEPVESSPGI